MKHVIGVLRVKNHSLTELSSAFNLWAGKKIVKAVTSFLSKPKCVTTWIRSSRKCPVSELIKPPCAQDNKNACVEHKKERP